MVSWTWQGGRKDGIAGRWVGAAAGAAGSSGGVGRLFLWLNLPELVSESSGVVVPECSIFLDQS